jgi:hypothetical protein
MPLMMLAIIRSFGQHSAGDSFTGMHEQSRDLAVDMVGWTDLQNTGG